MNDLWQRLQNELANYTEWRAAFLSATALLTRIPIGATYATPSAATLGLSVACFGLVGIVLGLGLILLAWLLPFPSFLTAAIIIFFWALASGFLHLDGLGDTADAWLAGGNEANQHLNTMHDSHNGAAAIATITTVLLVKYAATAALLSMGHAGVLVWVVFWGRSTAALMLSYTPCAQSQGMAAQIAGDIPKTIVTCLCLSLALVSLLLIGFWLTLVMALGALSLGYFIRYLCLRHLKGVTGDTLGATIELCEATVLCMALLVL